ncbi:hypothetical protein PZA11_003290 [Diplocarpon coronariae]|nr:hypothetical protein JHW43_003649 [Diplocarpon mali]
MAAEGQARLQALRDSSRRSGDFYEPVLTFGLELELDFAIRRDLYQQWLATEPTIPAPPQTPPGSPAGRNDFRNKQGTTEKSSIRLNSQDYHDDGGEEDVDGSDTPGVERQQATQNHRTEPDGPSSTAPDGSKASQGSFESVLTVSSRDSQDSYSLRQKLLMYFLAYLNRQLPTSRPGPSSLGEVIWGGYPKTARSDAWHLTWDDSVHPSRADLAAELGMTLDEVRKMYRCVGGEVVSQVLKLEEEQTWVPMIEQLHEDLAWSGDHGSFFTQQEHLHVHFAMADGEISLELAQTLCVLYGLFEAQIEKWVGIGNRDSMWCWRLRLGMERLRLQPTADGNNIKSLPDRRYTPSKFADLIYATSSLEQLRTATTGRPGGEAFTPDGKPAIEIGARDWTTVNVSMERGNKPTTFEFRHHHGTSDPEVVKWWVRFCGSMLKHAHLLVQQGVKLQDPTKPAPGKVGFLDLLVKENILDIIRFPPAGKAHFALQSVRNHDARFESQRIVDEMLVQERIVRRNLGQAPCTKMDDEMMNEQWYQDALVEYELPPLRLGSNGKYRTYFRRDKAQTGHAYALIAIGVALGLGLNRIRKLAIACYKSTALASEEASIDQSGQVAYWLFLRSRRTQTKEREVKESKKVEEWLRDCKLM